MRQAHRIARAQRVPATQGAVLAANSIQSSKSLSVAKRGGLVLFLGILEKGGRLVMTVFASTGPLRRCKHGQVAAGSELGYHEGLRLSSVPGTAQEANRQ